MAERNRIALAAFIATSVLAGGNAVAVAVTVRELAPLWGAGLRFVLAGILMGAVVVVMRLPWPRGRALLGAAVYGILGYGIAFACTYYALTHIPPGIGQTLLALVPLATLLLAVVQRQERLRVVSVIGTVLAVVGVGFISGASTGEPLPPLALLATLGAVLSFAQAAILVRRFPRAHPVTTNAVGFLAAAAVLVLAAVVAGETLTLPRESATWAAIAWIVPVGSGVVFGLYLVVLRYWTASQTAYGFVITPFVTVALSAWLEDEPVGVGLAVGGLFVLAGVYVGALRPATVKPPTDVADAPP